LLIHRLIASPDEEAPEQGVEAAWDEEIKRRVDDIRSGRVKAIPGEQVLRELGEEFPDGEYAVSVSPWSERGFPGRNALVSRPQRYRLGGVPEDGSGRDPPHFSSPAALAQIPARNPPARPRPFPFSIIYLDDPDFVTIIAIAHSKTKARILEAPRLNLFRSSPGCSKMRTRPAKLGYHG
jgi:putative addiction module component (TIGR02574 family)